MKQLEVQILQQSYLLGCAEGQEPRLMAAVERVDTAMTRIRDAGKVRARDRIAVLAALNLAFDLADREAAQQEASAHPAAQPPQEPPHLQDERLAALLDRLDQALAAGDAPGL
ncbi:cell division protein ZapA [Melaminivora sp.]|uniref:cell division protein ZapA n=1 Tax=Melaminivora sp. TaxID=1933032 RepID=UPI0028A7F5D2|nr:cell division protein ZapA [Melaminivora sp.]